MRTRLRKLARWYRRLHGRDFEAHIEDLEQMLGVRGL